VSAKRRRGRGATGSVAADTKTRAGVAGMLMLAACGGSATDARFPPREDGCPVKLYPGAPAIPVDELGTVQVECAGGGGGPCERQLENAVCRRGGDVAWGMADNPLNATALVAHAAHSQRAAPASRQRGCALQIYSGSVPMRTENVGPVTALCNEDDSPEVCTRELADQACLLGADVLWQVDGPTPESTPNGVKQRMHGRAAHTR
jgi:hypothetical protein